MKSTYTEAYQQLLVRLVAARHESGLTQAELAVKLGKPQSFVSKTENGERRLDVIEFLELGKILNFNPGEILEKISNRQQQ